MAKSSTSRSRSGNIKSARRREELRRNLPRQSFDFTALLQRQEFISGIAVALCFIIFTSIVVSFSREQLKVEPGRVMTETRQVRTTFQISDEQRTAEKIQAARDSTPQIYVPNEAYIEGLRQPLTNLPVIVADQTNIEDVSPEIRDAFQLDQLALQTLQQYSRDGKPTEQWQQWVDTLLEESLLQRPLIENREWQNKMAMRTPPVFSTDQLRPTQIPAWREAIRYEPQQASVPELEVVLRAAGFPAAVVPYLNARLAVSKQPTYVHNESLTELARDAAAEAVEPVTVKHEAGEVIYKRGDVLNPQQFALAEEEAAQFAANASVIERVSPRIAIIGFMTIIVVFVGTFLGFAYPRITRNYWRIIAVIALMSVALATTIFGAIMATEFFYAAAVAPTLFVTIVLLLAYDQRLATFLGIVQSVLVCLALEMGVAQFALLAAGCGTAILLMADVRNRNTLVRASLITAAVLGTGMILLGILITPYVDGALKQILLDASYVVIATLAVGFLILGILPSIERVFDITTGMTLAELRDPRNPLLRQLQQKALGTYNHSLQVANIAEAAAEAINADSLLVYVGALYHDIGKMNKPGYFVENQVDGENKHDKLRPAMSLLVIIGHVKDGIELAKEYALPRVLHHFIESHHGTTLVEYFYHAAKTAAEADNKREEVDEVEFRYPGPKPRTREAAILMLSDAVESATRAMNEPTPGRIEHLVRELSHKRLVDGQFDHSNLTFRELHAVEDSIIKSMCAVYHSRVAYPSGEKKQPQRTEQPTKSIAS